MTAAPRPLWPHQSRAVQEILAHIAAGHRWIVLSSPTGGGKTEIVKTLIKLFHLERGWSSIVFTNRTLLREQLQRSLEGVGLGVGVRAAGCGEAAELPVQVASIQTEYSRVYQKRGYIQWELFPAQAVFIDEAHLQGGKMAGRVKADYKARGAVIIEVTATPLDLDPGAEVLVQAGVNSELRNCGALVAARHYGPDEPDLRHIGRHEFNSLDELTEDAQRSLMGKVKEGTDEPTPKLQKLFGRVFEWYKRLNPTGKPAVLFAPGVPESRWFAKEFDRQGVKAAHIDGEEIWVSGGVNVKTSKGAREELLTMSREGTVEIICNRFVLREGIDCPWWEHGVFATPFGSLQSYLQSGGRLIRSHPGVSHVTIQDHGGNWWRHGSLNADRKWELGASSRVAVGVREMDLRNKKPGEPNKEPFRCPRCACIMMSFTCVCGFTMDPRGRTRPVVQEDGSLIEMRGEIFRPRKTELRADTQALWDREYFKARNKGKSFKEAVGNFYRLHGYFPPRTLANMPIGDFEMFTSAKALARDRLISKTDTEAR